MAWAEDGTAYVIDYGTCTNIDDLPEVASGLQYVTPSGQTVNLIGGMVDSAFNSTSVYRMCAMSGGFFYPARGSSARFGSIGESVVNDYPNLPLYTVNEFASKVALFIDRISKRLAPFLFFPKNATEDFLHAFMGQKITTNKKGRKEWRLVAGDHYADSVRLNYACFQSLRKSGHFKTA
jgi:hypothetical protein